MFDSAESLILALQLITAISFVVGLILLVGTVMLFRRSRRETYWWQRRQAGQRGFRAAFVTVMLLGLSAATCLISLAVNFVEGDTQDVQLPSATVTVMTAMDEAQATATRATPNSTMPSTDSAIPEANTMPVVTQDLPDQPISLTITPSPTDLGTLTQAPQNDLAPITTASPQITTPPNQAAEFVVAPTVTTSGAIPNNAVIQIRAIDDALSDDWQPIQEDTSFAASTQRLYFFFTYESVPQGIAWEQLLLKDGEVIQRKAQVWGITETAGDSLFFFGNQNGFLPGDYEVRITISDEQIPIASAFFTVE